MEFEPHRSMQKVPQKDARSILLEALILLWALCIYFKTVHFSFSSPFFWWYVKTVLFPRHLLTSSGLDTRSHPCWSQPSSCWGSEDGSDWVSMLKSLSLPLCCCLRSGIYGCSRQQWAVVSAFSPQWFPGWFLAEQASKQQPLHAGSSSNTSAKVPLSLSAAFRSLRWNSTTALPTSSPLRSRTRKMKGKVAQTMKFLLPCNTIRQGVQRQPLEQCKIRELPMPVNHILEN